MTQTLQSPVTPPTEDGSLPRVGSTGWLADALDSVVCGDNCDVLANFPRESVDLVVTSPPYDDIRTYGGHSWDFYGVAWQLKRVLKPGGVIVWVVADATVEGSETCSSMEQAQHFKRLGLRLHDTMIYHKPSMAFPRHGHTKYCGAWEYMFVLSLGAPRAWNPIKDRANNLAGAKMTGTVRQEDGTTKPSHSVGRAVAEVGARNNVWAYDVGFMKSTTDKIAFEHPATFPESLAKDHIASWSNPGDVVIDPFSGSGTTVKAAKELGRRFVGIDVNPEYCAIANRRLAQEVLNLSSANKADMPTCSK